MKDRKSWKKALSVLLSTAMVVGLIGVAGPKPVKAADPEANVLTNGDFEDASNASWKDQDGKLVGAQTVVDDVIRTEYMVNGDFEGEATNYNAGNSANATIVEGEGIDGSRALKFTRADESATSHPYIWFTPTGLDTTGTVTYTLSFKLRSTGAHWQGYIVENGATANWGAIGWTAADNTWTEYTYTFVTTTGTAQIGIQAVQDSGDIYIDNLSIYTEKTEEAVERQEKFVNGDFEGEATNYNSGNNANATIVEGEGVDGSKALKFTRADESATSHPYIWFTPTGLDTTGTVTYTLSFKLRSTGAHWQGYIVENGATANWGAIGWTAADNTWTEYTYTFVTTTGTAQVGIQAVQGSGDIYIDDFSVYTEEKVKVQDDKITGGNFEGEVSYSQGNDANATIVEEEGVDGSKALKFTRKDESATSHPYICFTPTGLDTTGTVTYTLSFKLRSTGAHWQGYIVENGATANWGAIGWTAADNTWTEYTYTFVTTTGTAQIGIQAVQGSGDIYIDEFRVYSEKNKLVQTYTEGIGKCNEAEPDNVLAMKDYTKVTQDVTIKKGDRYDYSFMVKSENAGEDLAFGITAGNNATDAVTVTSEWKEVTGSFTATEDAAEFGFTRGGTGTVLVDDVVLNETAVGPSDHTSMADGGYYIAIEDAVNLNAGGELSAKGDWFTSGAEVKDGMGVVHTKDNYLQTPVFNLTKDHTYTMSAYVWVEKANEGLVFDIFSAGAASPTGTWQDFGMAYWTAKGADCNRSASMSANTYGWELVTVTWTAKNDGPCYFGFKNYDGSGDVYVDDVAIYDHAIPEYVDIELSYAGSEYANNDFTVYVDNDLTEELWNTNYPSSAKTIVQASSVWINDTEYTNINYFFDAPNKKVTIWNVATNAGVAPESIEKVEIKAGTKIAFTGYPIARITKGFVIEKNAYGQWVDPSNTDTGEDCTLTFGWFDYYADKTAALNGMPAASGEYLPLSGAVLVNGDIYTATFTHNDTSATLNFNAGTLQNALSETEMNTVVIPKDLVLYNGKDAVCKIAEELTFYVQKKNGVWLSWTKDGYLTEEEHIQYFDMGTEGTTYTFNNNADATYMGVLTVTGKDTFALAGQENASKEVSALGDYFVSRTIKGEKYDYTVALYKRGDADSTMDGVLNSKDLVAAKKAVSADEATFGYARYKAADSNTDGVVDEEDVAFMRHILAGDHVITTTTSKGYSTLGQGVMPIIGYNGPSDCNTMTNTDATKRSAVGGIDNLLDGEDGERVFGLVKDLGINVFSSMVHEVGNDYDDSSRMLKMADKYGLGVFINNAYINDASSVAEQLSPQTAKYESFGSFYGYYVADEPKYSEINNFATTLDTLKNKVNIASYFNMFSVNASSTSIGTGDYATYLNRAAATSAETVSYDLYLRGKSYKYIGTSAEIKTSDFYKNLDQARTISMNASKPFQAFVQTGANWIDNTTNDKVDSSNKLTIQEMYLEANAALAMGAKGIHYFTLIESADQVKNGDDYSGLITVNGQANNNEGGNYAYYNAAKKINTYIAKVDEVLMNATSKGVITNSTIQGYMSADDTKLTSYGAVTSVTGTNAFVGCFDYYGKNAYMVVNTSTSASETITLNMADTITYTYTGMDCASHPGSGTLTLTGLGAGESVLVVVD